MTGPVPASPRQLSSWLRSHRKQAGAGAAVAAVVLFALYRRHVDAGAGDTSNTVAAAAGSGTLAADNTAGLSGTPDTSDDDIENWVQDSLNSLQGEINGQLATPTAPAAPAPPKAAPKPTSTVKFTLKSGMKYVEDLDTKAIFQVESNGQTVHVTPQEWAEITAIDPKRKVTTYGKGKPAKPPVAKPVAKKK